jgi:hypothetical protein
MDLQKEGTGTLIHTLQLPGVSKFRPYNGSSLFWELLLYFKRVAGGQQLNCNGVTDDAELEGKLHRGDSNGMVCKDQRCIHIDKQALITSKKETSRMNMAVPQSQLY